MAEVGADSKKKTKKNQQKVIVQLETYVGTLVLRINLHLQRLAGLIYYVIQTFLWLGVFSFVRVLLVD